MNSFKITIDGKEYLIKQSFRGMMDYEESTGKLVSDIKTTTDIVKFLYSMLKASNKNEWKYSFDEFIDVVDEHPEIFEFFKSFNSDSTEKKTQEKD